MVEYQGRHNLLLAYAVGEGKRVEKCHLETSVFMSTTFDNSTLRLDKHVSSLCKLRLRKRDVSSTLLHPDICIDASGDSRNCQPVRLSLSRQILLILQLEIEPLTCFKIS